MGWSDVPRDEPRARVVVAAREGYSCDFHYINPPLLKHRVSEISPLEQSTTGPAITHFWYWDMNKLVWQGPNWWVDGYTEVHRAEPAYPCQNGILIKN